MRGVLRDEYGRLARQTREVPRPERVAALDSVAALFAGDGEIQTVIDKLRGRLDARDGDLDGVSPCGLLSLILGFGPDPEALRGALADAGGTCLQGDTHRLFALYVALDRARRLNLPGAKSCDQHMAAPPDFPNSSMPLPHLSNPDPDWLDTDLGDGLVVIEAPGDGSCLFHAVLNAFDSNYRASDPYEDRGRLAAEFRQRLAAYLQEKTPGGTVYNSLMNGNLVKFAQETGLPEYTLEGMSELLRSTSSVGPEYIELVSRYLGMSIFLLYINRENVLAPYPQGEDIDKICHRPGRRAIVVLYTPPPEIECLTPEEVGVGHYETVARRSGATGAPPSFCTVFAPDDPLVAEMERRAASARKEAEGRGGSPPGEKAQLREAPEQERSSAPSAPSAPSVAPASAAQPALRLAARGAALRVYINDEELKGAREVPMRGGEEPLLEFAWPPGPSLNAMSVRRDGELAYLVFNVANADLDTATVVVPFPEQMDPGSYDVLLLDQGSAEPIEIPPDVALGSMFEIMAGMAVLGSAKFALARR